MTSFRTTQRSLLHFASGFLLLSCATLAQAQFMWVDAKGVKQVSDRPPPPSVPYKDILKAPPGQYSAKNLPPPASANTSPNANANAATAEPVAGSPAPAPVAPKAAPSLAEREADYIKRQKEKGEKDKKEADEKARRTAQAEYCLKVASNKAALDNGMRLSTADKNGERVVMDDEQRAVESKKVSEALAGCKNI